MPKNNVFKPHVPKRYLTFFFFFFLKRNDKLIHDDLTLSSLIYKNRQYKIVADTLLRLKAYKYEMNP
jgi:hypothetical protein